MPHSDGYLTETESEEWYSTAHGPEPVPFEDLLPEEVEGVREAEDEHWQQLADDYAADHPAPATDYCNYCEREGHTFRTCPKRDDS